MSQQARVEATCVASLAVSIFILVPSWANPRGNAIRGRPVDGVEQAHSTRPDEKNTGNFIGPSSRTVAEITLQRTDTTHDLSSESREAITKRTQRKPHGPNIQTTNKHTHLHRIQTFQPQRALPSTNTHGNHTCTPGLALRSQMPSLLVPTVTHATQRQAGLRRAT